MVKRILVATVLIAGGITVMLAPASAQIAGTVHDLSTGGGGTIISTTEDEVCVFCHTPHTGNSSALAPLWNHDDTTQTFTLYDSDTLDASDVGQPTGASKACMSCHDGVVGVNDLVNNAGSGAGTDPTMSGGVEQVSGTTNLGSDLSDDHPVSFTYNTALATADGEVYDPATQSSGLGDTIQNDMLFSDKMECASCHDVHDNTNGLFMIMDNSGSALCLTCHDK